jgi:hypothetical protein
MSRFKALFGSKKSAGSTSQKDNVDKLELPSLRPGFYGEFPLAFDIFFAGPSSDKKVDYYALGQSRTALFQTFSVFKGVRKHQITLHTTIDPQSEPLGLAGSEKLFRSTSFIAVPGSGESNPGPDMIQLKNNSKLTKDMFPFVVKIGTTEEQFEWRREDTRQQPVVRQLVRVANSNTKQSEVVGVWSEDPVPEREAHMGHFELTGSGATTELGRYWTLVAIMTLLRVNQANWEASAAAEKMIEASVKLVNFGVGFV